ncbi:MAG: DUF5074 domain-containing protein [Marinifilaceae bacterium]
MNLRRWTWALLMALMVFSVGCQQDDEVRAPEMMDTGLENNLVNLNSGESVDLIPDFDCSGSAAYKWILNGETVSNQPVYEFHADEPGLYDMRFEVANELGSRQLNYSLRVAGKYSSGVFIVNEGWFGHEPGSVHFWDRSSSQLQTNIFQNENPGKDLGITTQYACVQNGKFYLVSKGYNTNKGCLVVANAATLKEEGRVLLPNGQCRAFVALDDQVGFLSTGGLGTANGSGIYQVNLKNYTLGAALNGVGNQEVGNMMIASGKLFALKAQELLIYDIGSRSVYRTISLPANAGGMVKDKDGMIWVGAGASLLKVNPSNCSHEFISLSGASVNASYGWAWNAGSLTYSKTNHSLYFVNGGGWAPKSVGRFNIATRRAEDLFSIDPDYQIYGAGTYVDPVANKLYVTALKGFGQDAKYNRLYVYSLDGYKERVLNYGHFYFSALCISAD